MSKWIKSRAPFLAAFAAIFFLSTFWALSSPISSVPDEPSHTVKAAAVVRGQLGGQPTRVDGGQALRVQVPAWVAETQSVTCFAFHPDVTPNCWNHSYTKSREVVGALTTAGNYNPVYYAIVGLPSLALDGKLGFYAMRVLSALLNSLLLAWPLTLALRRPNGRWLAGVVALAVTPMVLYLNGAINPNSLEFSGMISFTIGLLGVVDGPRERSRQPLILTVVGGALLANAKADGLLWLLFGTLAVLLLSGLRPFMAIFSRRSVWVGAVVLGLAVGFALWWVLNHTGDTKAFAGAGMPWWNGLLVMLDRTGDYNNGLIGYFGWLDTPAPTVVILAWEAVFIGLVAFALVRLTSRARLAVLLAVVALIIVPPLLQAALVTANGLIWQGRYSLALFALLAVVMGRAFEAGGRQWTATESNVFRVLATFLLAGQAYAFLWAMRRYVTGISVERSWFQMLTHPTWQPPLAWEIWVAAFGLVVAIGLVALWRRDHREAGSGRISINQPADAGRLD